MPTSRGELYYLDRNGIAEDADLHLPILRGVRVTPPLSYLRGVLGLTDDEIIATYGYDALNKHGEQMNPLLPLKKMNPNHDEVGRFASGPGGAAIAGGVRAVRAWASSPAVKASIKKITGDLAPKAKDVFASILSAVITQHNQSNVDDEVVKQSVLNLSVGMKITAREARDLMTEAILKLRELRISAITKAKETADPVVSMLDRLLASLDKLDLPKDEPAKRVRLIKKR